MLRSYVCGSMNDRFAAREVLVSLTYLVGFELIIGLVALKWFLQSNHGIGFLGMLEIQNWQALVSSRPGIIGGIAGLAWFIFCIYAYFKGRSASDAL